MNPRDPAVLNSRTDLYRDYYDKPPWWFAWQYSTQVKKKTCLKLLSSAVRDRHGKSVFGLGFGPAATLLSFPRDCRLAGVETSPSAIRFASSLAVSKGFRNPDFRLVVPDAPIPFANDTFDVAVASHVLEHVPDEQRALTELLRVLKPGGALAVLVPVNERNDDPKHLRRFDFEGWKRVCEAAGFRCAAGFQNEVLFHLVEGLYWRHIDRPWGIGDNFVRIAFNVLTSRLPLWLCLALDVLVMRITGLPPRQAALLLVKPGDHLQ